MKKYFRVALGTLVILGGLAGVIFSLLRVLQGQWLWVVLALAAGALATAGWRLAAGDSVKEIAKDLLFVLMRTH